MALLLSRWTGLPLASILLAGCLFTAHPGYAVVIKNDTGSGYVIVVRNGLSAWGYSAPAHSISEIPGETWNAGIQVDLHSADCELIRTFPVPGNGFYILEIPETQDASMVVAESPPVGIVCDQTELCTGS